MKILAIDPGTITGWADSTGAHGTFDLTPRKAKPATKRRPAILPDPQERRPGRLFMFVHERAAGVDVVVCEGAVGYQRGKAAVRVSHELRGVVQAACWGSHTRYVEVQPPDLKRFATGSSVADKDQMIAAARARLGYTGDDDNEADALWLLAWARAHVVEPPRVRPEMVAPGEDDPRTRAI